MSEAELPSTEVKEAGSNKKAADTIKVVTVVLLKTDSFNALTFKWYISFWSR